MLRFFCMTYFESTFVVQAQTFKQAARLFSIALGEEEKKAYRKVESIEVTPVNDLIVHYLNGKNLIFNVSELNFYEGKVFIL